MKRENFNLGWRVASGVAQPFDAIFSPEGMAGEPVILPQDAMILESRDPQCPSGCQTGFYPAKAYTYTKNFFVPKDWEKKAYLLEFEGIMSRAAIFLNGNCLGTHKYGYSSIYTELTPYLKYGEENQLKVISVNSEKSSRWYPGSGIYRDVVLWHGGRIHLRPEAVRIRTDTLNGDYAGICLSYTVSGETVAVSRLRAEIRITDPDGNTVISDYQYIYIAPSEENTFSWHGTITSPKCWDVEAPWM